MITEGIRPKNSLLDGLKSHKTNINHTFSSLLTRKDLLVFMEPQTHLAWVTKNLFGKSKPEGMEIFSVATLCCSFAFAPILQNSVTYTETFK